MDTTSVPPGWYPAPHAGGELRYWDGTQWGQPPVPTQLAIPQVQQAVAARRMVSRGWMWGAIAACIAAAVLFFFAVLTSIAYSGAQSRISALDDQGGSSSSREGPDQADLAEMQATLDALESEIAKREAHLADLGQDSAGWATTQLNDGLFEVGVTVEAGIYQTDAVGENCQWNIYTGDNYYEDIVDFGAGASAPVTVTVEDGQNFSSVDCGIWNRIG